MKICETPNCSRCLSNTQFSSNWLQQHSKIGDGSWASNCFTTLASSGHGHPFKHLRQYYNIMAFLSAQYMKLPTEQINQRSYYYFLYQQYATAVKNLVLYIQNNTARVMTENTCRSSSEKILRQQENSQNKNTVSSQYLHVGESLSDEEHDVTYEARSEHYCENLWVSKSEENHDDWLCDEAQKVMTEKEFHPRRFSFNKFQDFDHEALTDSLDEDSKGFESWYTSYTNRIDCCFDKVQRRKAGNHTKWHNRLKNGIMLIAEKEYVFNEALVELAWEGLQNHIEDV